MASGPTWLGSGPDEGDLPGAFLEPAEAVGCGVRSGWCSRLLRAGTPRLRIRRGPSASHLHKGRAKVLGPTPLTIKLADVEGFQMKKCFCVSVPPSLSLMNKRVFIRKLTAS